MPTLSAQAVTGGGRVAFSAPRSANSHQWRGLSGRKHSESHRRNRWNERTASRSKMCFRENGA